MLYFVYVEVEGNENLYLFLLIIAKRVSGRIHKKLISSF